MLGGLALDRGRRRPCQEAEDALELLAGQGLRDVARDARVAGRALRKMLEGPDKERKALGTLQSELTRAQTIRRKAARQGRVDAFAAADDRVKELRGQISLGKAGIREHRRRLRAFQERGKGEKDTHKDLDTTKTKTQGVKNKVNDLAPGR